MNDTAEVAPAVEGIVMTRPERSARSCGNAHENIGHFHATTESLVPEDIAYPSARLNTRFRARDRSSAP